jgi:hypothetical protein
VSPKKQKIEKDDLATTETVITSSLVDKISGVNRSVVEDIIMDFITRIAEWTEYEKSMHRERLLRIDVIRKRENLAANKAMCDFDVYDDDASCWKECDDSIENGYDYNADYLKNDFDEMVLPLLRVLDGITAKVTAYEPKYQLGSASILTVDAKQARGCTHLNFKERDPGEGTSAFKFKPSFFDVAPGDLLIKFVSNLLGLDDSAHVTDLLGFHTGNECYTKEDETDRNDDVRDGMRGKDPAWIIVGRTGRGDVFPSSTVHAQVVAVTRMYNIPLAANQSSPTA